MIMFRANSSRPPYRITYYEFSIDGQERWLVKVEKKVRFLIWERYTLLADYGIELVSIFPTAAKKVVECGFKTHEEARKWALDKIQHDAEDFDFNGEKTEGVWL